MIVNSSSTNECGCDDCIDSQLELTSIGFIDNNNSDVHLDIGGVKIPYSSYIKRLVTLLPAGKVEIHSVDTIISHLVSGGVKWFIDDGTYVTLGRMVTIGIEPATAVVTDGSAKLKLSVTIGTDDTDYQVNWVNGAGTTLFGQTLDWSANISWDFLSDSLNNDVPADDIISEFYFFVDVVSGQITENHYTFYMGDYELEFTVSGDISNPSVSLVVEDNHAYYYKDEFQYTDKTVNGDLDLTVTHNFIGFNSSRLSDLLTIQLLDGFNESNKMCYVNKSKTNASLRILTLSR
jgi:hypothetical protein